MAVHGVGDVQMRFMSHMGGVMEKYQEGLEGIF
jgi:hypothetical protein